MSSIPSNSWPAWLKESQQKDALLISIAIVAFSWVVWMINKTRKGKALSLPPGPRGLPLIGNLPFMQPNLHLYFAKLSETYGPIFKLRLGKKLVVVLGSPAMAKEVLKDHDTTFANHYKVAAALVATYGGSDIVWSPYGPNWRMLRRICIQELLNAGSLDASSIFRIQQVRQTVSDLYAKIDTPIDVGENLTQSIFNSMTSTLWGSTVKGGSDTGVAAEFRQVVAEIGSLLGQPNISDLFPLLAKFDVQGVERKMKKAVQWFDRIIQTILDERLKMEIDSREVQRSNEEHKDFLDILLKIKEQGDPKTPLTMTHIKALLLDLVTGGSDTSSTTLEWAMAEMLQKPEIMRTAQEELDAVVGKDNVLENHHLSQLYYLDAVMKEALRLHPPNGLLIPHTPSESCVVGGYNIPKDSGVFVNLWAIHRDPTLWEKPLEFEPERFLGSGEKWDYRGKDFRYFPFGSGRRICPGISLAEQSSLFLLGSLLHSFDWRLPEGSKIDLSDKFLGVIKIANPVMAIPTPRLSSPDLYAVQAK